MTSRSFTVRTGARFELVDITAEVQETVRQAGGEEGICVIYVPHTTAAVTISENADPAVARDIIQGLDKLIPLRGGYEHAEGNSAAHIKSTIVGCSQSVPFREGRLALGRWQGIFFCEFDGPRTRTVTVHVV